MHETQTSPRVSVLLRGKMVSAPDPREDPSSKWKAFPEEVTVTREVELGLMLSVDTTGAAKRNHHSI
jgi:hypothetical protein